MRQMSLLGVFCFSLLSLSCSRNLDRPSNLYLDLSSHSQSSSSSNQIFFISVNITGPGITNPIVWNWEAPWNATNTTVPPTHIQLTVPKGDSRLVQYLSVSRTASGSLSFEYGDAVKSLSAAAEEVNISPQTLGTAAREINVSGRMMTGAGTGPTGRVAMKYKPSNRPSMRILYTEIFGGWFSKWIALESADTKFDYVLVDASGRELATLFNQLGPNSSEFTASESVIKAIYPAGYRSNDSVEAYPGGLSIVGYFGVGAGSKRVCYQSMGGSYVSSLYQDSGLTTPVAWSSSVPNVAGGEAGRLGGGISLYVCSALTEFSDFIPFDGASFESDRSRGFKGPFRRRGSSLNSPFLGATWESSSQTLNLAWSYLPGLFATSSVASENISPLTGATLFYHLNHPSANLDILDSGPGGLRCDELTKLGFSALTLQGSAQTTASIPGVTRAHLEMNRVKVVLCPQRGAEYFSEGIETYGLQQVVNYAPSFRLAGGNTAENQITQLNNIINANDKLLRAEVTNSYHVLYPHIGNRLLSTVDLSSMDFSVNGGTWTSYTNSSPGISMSSGYVAGVNLNDGNFVGAISSSGNNTVRFRFQLTGAAASRYGFESYTSPALSLIGNACASPVLKVRKGSGEKFTSTDMLDDVFAGDANHNALYKLIWEGANCQDATAAISSIQVTPQNACLMPSRDITYDSLVPFGFRISPVDTLGADCTLPSGSMITFQTPGTPGYDTLERSIDGQVVSHATNTQRLGAYLTNVNSTTPNNPYRLGLRVKKIISAATSSFSFMAANETDDKTITVRNLATSFPASISWVVNSNHFNSPGSSPFFTLTLSGADTVLRAQMFNSGLNAGSFSTLINPVSQTVVAVSQQTFMGGSPLWVIRSGSNEHSVYHLKGENGVSEGYGTRRMGTPSLVTTERVFIEPVPTGIAGTYHMFAMAYGNTLYLAVYNHATGVTSWSPAIVLTDTTRVVGMHQSLASQNLLIYTRKTDGTLGIYDLYGLGSLYSGSSWSTPASYALSSSRSEITPFDVVRCGHGFAAIGAGSGDPTQGTMIRFQNDGYNLSGSALTYSSLLNAQNRGTCMLVQGSSGFIELAAFYSTLQTPLTSGHTFNMISRNTSGSSQCGLSPSTVGLVTPVGGLSTALSNTNAAGQMLSAFATGERYVNASDRGAYLLGYFPTASGVQVGRYTVSCAGGSMSYEYVNVGSFGKGHPMLRDLVIPPAKPEGEETAWFFGTLGSLVEVMLQ